MGREGVTGAGAEACWALWEQVQGQRSWGVTHLLWSSWCCSLKGTELRFLPLWPLEPRQGGCPGRAAGGAGVCTMVVVCAGVQGLPPLGTIINPIA